MERSLVDSEQMYLRAGYMCSCVRVCVRVCVCGWGRGKEGRHLHVQVVIPEFISPFDISGEPAIGLAVAATATAAATAAKAAAEAAPAWGAAKKPAPRIFLHEFHDMLQHRLGG